MEFLTSVGRALSSVLGTLSCLQQFAASIASYTEEAQQVLCFWLCTKWIVFILLN